MTKTMAINYTNLNMNTFEKNVQELERNIGHKFKDRHLIHSALTHESVDRFNNYQRLEFFGDSVLGMIISDKLYEFFDKREGNLTYLRQQIISNINLSRIGLKKDLDLPKFVRVARNERFEKWCDIIEALIGALYRDGGIESATQFVMKYCWDPQSLKLDRPPHRPHFTASTAPSVARPHMFSREPSSRATSSAHHSNHNSEPMTIESSSASATRAQINIQPTATSSSGIRRPGGAPLDPPGARPLVNSYQTEPRIPQPAIISHPVAMQTKEKLERYMDENGIDRRDLREHMDHDPERALDLRYMCQVVCESLGTHTGCSEHADDAVCLAYSFAYIEAEEKITRRTQYPVGYGSI